MSIFKPIHHARSAEEVAHQIEALILQGVLRPRDRLPGERELAAETDVSRPIVRQAIKKLEEGGLLISRHGEGTFVADIIGTVFSPQVSSLLASHETATADYLEYRREIEAIASALAAQRATPADVDLLKSIMIRMEEAHAANDFDSEADVDLEFHALIGEMAHNVILLHTLRACYQLLSAGIFENRTKLYHLPDSRSRLLAQHHAVADAIMAGDAAGAADAARAHIDYVISATGELAAREERERISSLRLERLKASA